ncbi:glycerol-3-phosphate dehydrogenase [NAD(P)+] [Formosimonas limnophila]|uniref:Glycerol-3-phosphate dehydrogenase [NAD(P)+] n=1 Tax=Formosimonas limnophila TaxID=1384487 RepID=A0A8J3CN87_9BURK|nr:NAD(P)H-dependent glycerol-3-phosphate dehydrogenase [Formosimonas limnophila]GHA76674.1 glycerol-3-phosphate dehydrogenase [NAD(P)+] [Formosimonas limnophila]
MNIAILGAGAWGSALASSLAEHRPDHRVTLWGRDELQMTSIAQTHFNSAYLPSVRLSQALSFSSSLDKVIQTHAHENDLIIIATPLAALREMVEHVKRIGARALVLWLCKGLSRDSAQLPHQIVFDVLGATSACGVLSGPSFAQEVAQAKPCALTLASNSVRLNALFAQQLHHSALRIYHTHDVIGVELGGALKNVLAIAAGVCDGLSLGMNARAALLTRGVAEMLRLGQALGAQPATLTGLTGLGDLILTATGSLSRNRAVGLELAKGRSVGDITIQLGHVAEGALCAHAMARLAHQHGVDMPITQTVCALLDGMTPQLAVQQLLSREPTTES